jgi:voltage-gated potassium channel Kch
VRLYDPAMQSILVMGDGALANGVGDALVAAGRAVRRLRRWNDRELRRELEGDVGAVVVVSRDDIAVLRTALLVEYLRPGVRLTVTIFDRTVADQVIAAIPNCEVLSMADAALGAVLGPCVDARLVALQRERGGNVVAVAAPGDGEEPRVVDVDHRPPPRHHRLLRRLAEQLRPYDHVSRVMLGSLVALFALVLVEAVIVALHFHEGFDMALYNATKVTATVGSSPVVDAGPAWLHVYAVVTIALALVLVAVFTASVVRRFESARLTGIVGARTVPRFDHVVVVGLGQVGFRLCLELRRLGIPVLAVEQDIDSPWVRIARRRKIPIVIGRGGDRFVLERLSLGGARALAAVTSDELVNVNVSVAALAVEPALRTVLRAGSNEVTRETQALFPIGVAVDVVRVAAVALAGAALGDDDVRAFGVGDATWLLEADGSLKRFPG